MRFREEVDVHVSAKAAPHIREEEIDPVQSNEPHEGDRLAKMHDRLYGQMNKIDNRRTQRTPFGSLACPAAE